MAFQQPAQFAVAEEEKVMNITEQDEKDKYIGSHNPPLGSFDDLLYYAKLAREEENKGIDSRKPPTCDDMNDLSEKEKERINMRRALRNASWLTIFYLITTDILGPFNAPYAISQTGYALGVTMYIIMGFLAFYTGLILWKLYCTLDSPRYPIKTYGDLADRIFGSWFRYLCTVLQSIQLIFNVALIVLSSGQSLYQVVTNNHKSICFAAAIVIFVAVGLIIGQIRTLSGYGYLANFAIWLNLSVIFISMGFFAHSGPNLVAAAAAGMDTSQPVVTQAISNLPLYNQVNGVLQMVFAYGGAMIFPEMMAEMRRPWDFWKGMACAQGLIFLFYMMYGVFVYSFQGQYTQPVSYQGLTGIGQDICNVVSLVSGIIAAGLYGNIGIKIVYITIVEDWLKGPSLLSFKGRLIWSPLVLVFWVVAFIIGSAIPVVGPLSGFVAAIAILQFSYTFPPLFLLGYEMIMDAAKADGDYVHGQVRQRADTWRQLSRWKRAFFTGRWYLKLFNLFIFLGGLTFCGLGLWGSVLSMEQALDSGSATALGCSANV